MLLVGVKQSTIFYLLIISTFIPYYLHASDLIQYRIQNGDNLTAIANKFGVSVNELRTQNHITSENKILRGTILKIYKQTKQNNSDLHLFNKEEIHTPPFFIKPINNAIPLRKFTPWGDNKNYGVLWLANNTNEKVICSFHGTIVKQDYLRGYGKYIIIDHGYGWLSMYSNINLPKYKIGQHIKQGETLGIAKEKNIFFLISYKGTPLDPMLFIKNSNKVYHDS